MTSQVKNFIELSDIIGLRLQCKRCKCSLLVGVEGETIHELLSPHNYLLAKCPTCGDSWCGANQAATVALRTASFDSEIKQLFRMLAQTRDIEPKLGCSLMLEIKHDSVTQSVVQKSADRQ